MERYEARRVVIIGGTRAGCFWLESRLGFPKSVAF